MANELPQVGDYITEGMGIYLVRKALGGTLFGVESHVGTSLIIDFFKSGYRTPQNAWRIHTRRTP